MKSLLKAFLAPLAGFACIILVYTSGKLLEYYRTSNWETREAISLGYSVRTSSEGQVSLRAKKYLYLLDDKVYSGSGSEKIVREDSPEIYQLARNGLASGRRIQVKVSPDELRSRLDSNHRAFYHGRWLCYALIYIAGTLLLCRKYGLLKSGLGLVGFSLGLGLFFYLLTGPEPMSSRDRPYQDPDIYEFYLQVPEDIEQVDPTLIRRSLPLGKTGAEMVAELGYMYSISETSTSDGEIEAYWGSWVVTFREDSKGIFRSTEAWKRG